MPARKRAITAAEFAARQRSDPAFLERQQQNETRWKAAIEEHKVAAKPIIEDLRRAGFNFDSVDELRSSGTAYAEAVPILLKWLPIVQDRGVKESVVRALSVPWAKSIAAVPLIEAFRNASGSADEGLKWAIGSALEIVGDDSVFVEISELALEKRHGKAREMLAIALGNMKDPAAVDVLIGLLKDEEVAGHAVVALGNLRAVRARPEIEMFLQSPKAWVREEAAKALQKFDGATHGCC